MKAIISEKGQITVPKECRNRLGLRTGTVLDIVVFDGKMVGVKIDPVDPIHKWRGKGVLPAGKSVDTYLAEVRR
ncbi:MAG: AbrB/MazE/SpoVT family DNA-binding domain-containing protein [Kiritimatiellia bacterium]